VKKSKKSSKTTKSSTKKKKSATKVIDQYRDIFTFRMRPVSEAFLERLAKDMVDWAYNDDNALKITTFYISKGISATTMNRWYKRNEILKLAHDIALMIIGDRREIGAIKNKYNTSLVMSQMAKYDSSWWELEKKRAQLRADTKKQEESNVVFKVVVDDNKKHDDKASKTNESVYPPDNIRPQLPKYSATMN